MAPSLHRLIVRLVLLTQLPGLGVLVGVGLMRFESEHTRATQQLQWEAQAIALALHRRMLERQAGTQALAPMHGQEVLSQRRLPPGWITAIVNPQGVVATRGLAAPGSTPLVWDAATGPSSRPGIAELRLVDGTPIVAGVTTAPVLGWGALAGGPRSGRRAAAWRAVAPELAGYVALMLVMLGVSVQLARRTIDRAELRTEAQRLHALLHSASDAIVLADAQDRIERMNPAAARIFGGGEDTWRGQPLARLLDARTVDQFASSPPAGQAARAPAVAGWGRRADGGAFPLECSLARYTDAEGRAFATLTARDITQRLENERSLAAARAELQRVNHAFQRELLRETESRQQAIARELHDAIGSALAGIGMLLGTARNFTHEPEAAALISQSEEQVKRTTQQIRRISRGMMPAGQDRGALLPALEQFAADMNAIQAVHCTVAARGDFVDVPAEVGGHLFRIVQEATANALRHGHARNVRVRLLRAGPLRRLTIRDDGSGCDPDALFGPEAGLGMRSMHARAEAIRGRLEVCARRGGGVRVRVTWSA